MSNRKLLGIAGAVLIAGLLYTLLMTWLFSDKPSVVFRDGVVDEILNCDIEVLDNLQKCNALRCMKEIYSRKVVQPYASLSLLQQTFVYRVTDRYFEKNTSLEGNSEHYFESNNIGVSKAVKCQITNHLIEDISVVERSAI